MSVMSGVRLVRPVKPRPAASQAAKPVAAADAEVADRAGLAGESGPRSGGRRSLGVSRAAGSAAAGVSRPGRPVVSPADGQPVAAKPGGGQPGAVVLRLAAVSRAVALRERAVLRERAIRREREALRLREEALREREQALLEQAVRAAALRAARPRTVVPARVHGQPGAAPRAARPATWRLTRRGRMLLAVLAVTSVLAVVAVVWLTAAAGAQASSSGVPASDVYRNMTQVVVQPGQSLWTIASQVQPSADPTAVEQQIIDANGLSGSSIQPGERLWVPTG